MNFDQARLFLEAAVKSFNQLVGEGLIKFDGYSMVLEITFKDFRGLDVIGVYAGVVRDGEEVCSGSSLAVASNGAYLGMLKDEFNVHLTDSTTVEDLIVALKNVGDRSVYHANDSVRLMIDQEIAYTKEALSSVAIESDPEEIDNLVQALENLQASYDPEYTVNFTEALDQAGPGTFMTVLGLILAEVNPF